MQKKVGMKALMGTSRKVVVVIIPLMQSSGASNFHIWYWRLRHIWRMLHGKYALKLIMGFQQCLAHLPSFWLVSQGTSHSQHLVEQGFNTWHKSTTMWKASWVLSHWGNK